MNKITSGIEGFDKLIFGGFPSGRAYLVSGEPGTGKSTFSMQFLLEGIKQGGTSIYITMDEKPEHLVMDAKEMGWDLSPYLNNGHLQIIDVTKHFSSIQDNGTIEPKKIISEILGYVKKVGATRLAIDPIAPVILADSGFLGVVEYIRGLIFAIEDNTNCTTLLTSYVPVGSEKVSAMGIEEFAASGIIILRFKKLNNKIVRVVSVSKMRGTRVDLTEYTFEILPERGVVLRQPL